MPRFFIVEHISGPVAGHFTVVEIQQTCDGTRWRFTERHFKDINAAKDAVAKLQSGDFE